MAALGIIVLVGIAVALWVVKHDVGHQSVADVSGTDPVIMPPRGQSFPTIKVADAVGWSPTGSVMVRNNAASRLGRLTPTALRKTGGSYGGAVTAPTGQRRTMTTTYRLCWNPSVSASAAFAHIQAGPEPLVPAITLPGECLEALTIFPPSEQDRGGIGGTAALWRC